MCNDHKSCLPLHGRLTAVFALLLTLSCLTSNRPGTAGRVVEECREVLLVLSIALMSRGSSAAGATAHRLELLDDDERAAVEAASIVAKLHGLDEEFEREACRVEQLSEVCRAPQYWSSLIEVFDVPTDLALNKRLSVRGHESLGQTM